MSEEKLEVPDGVLDALLLTPQVLSKELRLAAAMKLYDRPAILRYCGCFG